MPAGMPGRSQEVKMQDELSKIDDADATNTAGNMWASNNQPNEKHYKPKPPEGHQDPELKAKAPQRSQPDAAAAAPPVKDRQQLDFSAYLRFDEHGMILPHSILGSLEDFRGYMEARGEKDLLKHFQKPYRDPLSEAKMGPHTDTAESKKVSGQKSIQRSTQRNALQNWDKQMKNRRQKQKELSYSLRRPVESLLMNQDKHFRENKQQREILNRAMPLAHSGYGYRVGSEFWSVPQRYGDEVSGITATLTQTERGQKKPITHVGHPSSIQREMGIIPPGTESPASPAWGQSSYLQSKSQELQDILQEMDFKKPDISKLEVIGTGQPLMALSERHSLSLQKEEEERKQNVMKKEEPNRDSLAETVDAEVMALPFPALRINGQLANWTGHPTSEKGEVGISISLLFESQTGEVVTTDLELVNVGRTVIFYSWKKLPRQQSLSHLYTEKNPVRFYRRSSSDVICPGQTQRVEFIFKSEEPGLSTEVWQLNTHPLLLQGASIQIRLSGVAFKQDKSADQRHFLEDKLEKVVVEKFCRRIVGEMVGRVHSPERPQSPAELYITEEQLFHNKNPKLQYHYQPVEDLKALWQQVNPGDCWDFSVDALRQAVLSLPDAEPLKEESFSQLNSLYLQLCEPPDLKHRLLPHNIIRTQLCLTLDRVGGEAIRLRAMFGLPENKTWADVTTRSPTEDKIQSKRAPAATEKTGFRRKLEDGKKSESRPPTDDSSLAESKTRGKKKDDSRTRSNQKQGKESDSPADVGSEIPMEIERVDKERLLIYRRALHEKVYTWMGDFVGNLCDLMSEGDENKANCCA